MKKMIKNKELLLITTKGCIACDKQKQIVDIVCHKYNIKYKIKDVSECSKEFLQQNGVTDFPTTLLFSNGALVSNIIGTCTENKIWNTLYGYQYIR